MYFLDLFARLVINITYHSWGDFANNGVNK